MTKDRLYKDPALVLLYDAVNASCEDFAFYLGQMPAPPARLLDIGCGTGRFALDLTARGYAVVAVDPAPQMIAAARRKAGADAITWVTGLVSDLPQGAVFDCAVMTGHAFQCLQHDRDIAGLFQSVAARLVPDGSFWFETRNAGARPWAQWTPEHARPPIALPDGRQVQVVHRVLKVDGEHVTFEERYVFGDDPTPVISRSTLRFPPLETICGLASAQGLEVKARFGDWRKGALHADSPEIILGLEKRGQKNGACSALR